MKKLMLAGFCAMLLAACGGGANNSGSTGGGDSSGCSAEEAPELKGLEGAEKEAMQAAVAFRDKMKALKKRADAAAEDEKEKVMEELEGMEGDYKAVLDKIDKLSDEGKKKFDAITKEIDDLGEAIEDALKPKG